MLRESLRDKPDEPVEINMTPMIDCVLFLLIFFILTSKFADSAAIPIEKPEAATGAPVAQDSVVIALTADERVFYGGQEIGMFGIRPTVQRIVQSSDLAVIIEADQNVRHGFFAKAYGEARAGGATKIQFATKDEAR
jgi:biopolymer transport protein ExbD